MYMQYFIKTVAAAAAADMFHYSKFNFLVIQGKLD